MTRKAKPAARKKTSHSKQLSAAKPQEMIEEATVDAYDESEQTSGFYTMFEEYLALPFKTEVLGVEVIVERIDITDDERIASHREEYYLDGPEGFEWIEAYRRWARGGR